MIIAINRYCYQKKKQKKKIEYSGDVKLKSNLERGQEMTGQVPAPGEAAAAAGAGGAAGTGAAVQEAGAQREETRHFFFYFIHFLTYPDGHHAKTKLTLKKNISQILSLLTSLTFLLGCC